METDRTAESLEFIKATVRDGEREFIAESIALARDIAIESQRIEPERAAIESLATALVHLCKAVEAMTNPAIKP